MRLGAGRTPDLRYRGSEGQGAIRRDPETPVHTGKDRIEIDGQRIAASEKIKRELDWRPQFTDLEGIVRSAWEWRRAHPNGYAS